MCTWPPPPLHRPANSPANPRDLEHSLMGSPHTSPSTLGGTPNERTSSASSPGSGNVLLLLGKTALILKTTTWQALYPHHPPAKREQSDEFAPILQTRESRLCEDKED